MRRCTRVGIDVTKRCNWKCRTCFYRWKSDFNQQFDRHINDVWRETVAAKERGCDHAVLVGWGEPGLWPPLLDYLARVESIGMSSSIITNGSLPVSKYAAMRAAGLNHLHVSIHGIGAMLDEISGVPGSGDRQKELLEWLKAEKWPWRMNMTVQKVNHKELSAIAEMCLDAGCRHIISLGFLPHYEWNDPEKLRQVAVHPAELREDIEKVFCIVENFNEYEKHGYKAMITVRYHPMCHLSPEYRKYVVNARYVLYDPWEWDYGAAGRSDESYWNAALDVGNTVAIQADPCRACGLNIHCGGWNRIYADGFDGALLQAVEMPEETKIPGWLHDQNPANHGNGWF